MKESTEIKQVNDVTESRRVWSPLETRCYVQVVGEFEERYQYWKETRPKTIFGDDDYSLLRKYSFPAAEIDPTNLVRVKQALIALAKDGMYLDSPDGSWLYCNILDKVDYNARTKMLNVSLSMSFIPYLVTSNEKGGYTTYNACIAKQFKGRYTERFYEWICQYRRYKDKAFFMSLKDIRDRLGFIERDKNGNVIEEKFTRYNDLKRRVLEPARKEMLEYYKAGTCDVYFDYTVKDDEMISEGGRPAVSRIWFTFHEKEILVQKVKEHPKFFPAEEQQQAVDLLTGCIDMLLRIFNDEHGRNYLHLIEASLMQLVIKDKKRFIKLIEKIRLAEVDENVRSKPSYIRTILEDFGIEPTKKK